MENCEWSDMTYIGDNPNKDFVNLTPLGVRTIRVLTGEHRDIKAKPGFEAAHVIASLNELPPLLEKEIV
jgi:putative hydrolase of the HAD superfamily